MSIRELAGSLERFGRALENLLLATVLTSMIGLAALQILMREGFNASFEWGDELLRIMVLWITLLGAVAASRDDNHIRIDVLSRFLAPVARAWLGRALDLVVAAVCAVIAWYAYQFVLEVREFGDLLVGGLPAWWFQSILPIGFGLIAYRYLLRAVGPRLPQAKET